MAVNGATALDALFKEYHETVIAQQFPQATPFYSEIKDAGSEWQVTQKGWSANAYLRQESSNKWGQPGMAFPAGSTFSDKRFHAYRAKYHKSHEIDGSTYIDLEMRKEIALINEMEIQKRLMLDAAVEMEEACLGDSSGKKGVVLSASTTVITNQVIPDGTHAGGFGVDHLIEEGFYDILTSAGATADASHINVQIPVGGISRSGNTVTFGTALGAAPAAGSIWVYNASYNQYQEGIRSLIDGGKTTWFQGIDASTEPYLNSAKIDAGATEISVNLVQNLMVKYQLFNAGQPLGQVKMYTSPTQLALYMQQGYGLVRINDNSGNKTFNVSFDKADYNGVQMQSLATFDPDALVICDKTDFRRLVGRKLGLWNMPNGIVWQQKQGGSTSLGYDVWYILYGYEGNLAILTPRKHAIMVNLLTTGMTTPATRFSTTV